MLRPEVVCFQHVSCTLLLVSPRKEYLRWADALCPLDGCSPLQHCVMQVYGRVDSHPLVS